MQLPLSISFAGQYAGQSLGKGSGVLNRDAVAGYWTNAKNSANGADRLMLNASLDDFNTKNNSFSSTNGFTIRCLLRHE